MRVNSHKLRTDVSPWVAVAVALALGGASPVLSKYLLRTFTLESLLVWRYSLSLIVLVPAVKWRIDTGRNRGGGPSASVGRYASLACVGILGSGVGAVLFTSSLQYAPAAVSNALSKSGPLFVAFLAHLLLNESVSIGTVGLLVAMLLGAGLLGAGEVSQPMSGTPIPLLGALLAVMAGLVRAGSEVAAKSSLASWPAANVAAARFLGGAVLAAVLGLCHPASLSHGPHTTAEWVALLVLAWFCTSLPVALYYWGMGRVPVHIAAGVRPSGAVVTAVISWAALGEALNILHLLGIGALLLAAFAMASMPTQRGTRPRARPGPVRSLLQLVSLIVGVSVLVTGLLQAWQLQALMQKQVQATLGRTAALIGEVVALKDRVQGPVLRDFLDRLVDEQISTPGYTAEFACVVIADAAGVPVAWAFRKEKGWDITPEYEKAAVIARRGLEALGRQDLIPTRVRVYSQGKHVGDLYVGYHASIAWWPLLAVLARSGALGLVMALVAAIAVLGLVRRALGPLAAFAAQLREQAEAVQNQDMATAAKKEAMPDAAIARWLESGATVLPYDDHPRVIACAKAPQRVHEWLVGVMAALSENEGTVAGVARGWIVAAWGTEVVEVDDPKWACLWVFSLPAGPRILAVIQDDWEELLSTLQTAEERLAALDPAGPRNVVLATEHFVEIAGEYITTCGAGNRLYCVEGLRE
jgi:drug/metabolite transporter (DMT)-like permease